MTILVTSVYGQRFSFKRYDQADGLVNQSVRALLQDRAGFLWVATPNGLYRYDGRRFREFTKADGLPSPQVQALQETPDGTLWAASVNGLARLAGDRFEVVDISPGRGAVSLGSDSAGRLYVGSDWGLLVSESAVGLSGKPVFRHYTSGSQKAEVARGIAVSGPGQAWFACGRRLCRLDAGRVLWDQWDAPEDDWDAVLIEANGSVWARSRTQLIELPAGGSRFIRRDGGLPPAAIAGSLGVDRSGGLWVPTIRGLARRASDKWEIIGKAQGLPVSTVLCMLQDREGSIWIGMSGGGLARWLGFPSWEYWTESEGLSTDSLWAIRRDAVGTLWGAGDMGLNRFNEVQRRWEDVKIQGLPPAQTTVIAPLPDGSMWVGQSGIGAVHVDLRSRLATRYGKDEGVDDRYIFSITVDSRGRVWVGTRNGLYRGSRSGGRLRFERYALPNEPNPSYVYTSLIDRNGSLWVGASSGLFRLDGEQWTRMTTRDGLLHNRVQFLAEATDGTVWIGYAEPVGLSAMTADGGKLRWRHFSSQNGLTSEKGLFLGADARGWIWFGTDHGVDLFDGKGWRHIDHTDGMVWDDCSWNGFHADRDGSVWIGTARGVASFQIGRDGIPSRPTAASAILTSIAFGGRPVPIAPVSLPWSQRSLTAGLAALTFVNQENLRFRYRIIGLDDRWNETRQSEIYLPALPAGQFHLEVQADTGRRLWNTPPARFDFAIRPAWWAAWWARLMLLAIGCFVGWRLWRYRVREILRRQSELESAVAERTRALEIEKLRAEQGRDLAAKQKLEIERLLGESQISSRLKDEFLATISHEIRTPMTGVLGMAELLAGTALDSGQAEHLRLIQTSARSLLSILNDILDFSRIQAGRLELESLEFDPRTLAADVVKTMGGDASKKGLLVRLQTADRVPRRLLGDSGRLRQLLVNLLSNAVKFTDKGRIEVDIDAEPKEQAIVLHFRVEDTGPGIPLDRKQLIFEPFRQADGSTSRRYGGTGLGLAICSRLVALMGGRIWVESELGKGSTFHFTAEVRPSADAEPEAAPVRTLAKAVAEAGEAPGRRLNILLAEDNPVNQKIAACFLEKRGHSITIAADGCEAVSLVSEGSFDVVLMDVHMPRMDGLEAMRRIRAAERIHGWHTPIIAMTACAMAGDREKCLGAGMDDYIDKPIDRAKLIQTVERCADVLSGC